MSYDLMVFRKEAAPQTRDEFMKWFEKQTQWAENHSYNDPSVTSIELGNWFMEMIQTFPAMNGPFSIHDEDDIDNDMITGYSIGTDSIYLDFRWSVVELAYETVFKFAAKHEVGFFDVSSDEGDIFFPENGELKAIDRKTTKMDKDPDNYIVYHTVKTDDGIVKYSTVHKNKLWWQFWR